MKKIKRIRILLILTIFLCFELQIVNGQINYSIRPKVEFQNLKFNILSISFIPADSIFDTRGNIRAQFASELKTSGIKTLNDAYYVIKLGYYQSDSASQRRNEKGFRNIKNYFKKNKSEFTTLIDINCQDILMLNYKASQYEQITSKKLSNSIYISIYKSKEKTPRMKKNTECYL